MKTARPLAKALHTVTVVARVAVLLTNTGTAYDRTVAALHALGYSDDQIAMGDPALFDACHAAVAKAIGSPLALVA